MAFPTPLDLSVVVVHYRSTADTVELVGALRGALDAARHEVLVVDHSPETPLGDLDDALVRVLRPGRNLGFGGGVNHAHARARGRLVLILNPDVRPHAGAIERLLEAHARHPRAAVLAPRLLNPDGSDQDSTRTFYRPETIVAARTPWGATARGRRVLDAHLGAVMDRAREQTVDWALGAALLVDPARLGARPGELMDLCLRAWRAGAEVRYVPAAVFTHRHRRESRTRPWSAANLRHFASLLKFVAKHGGFPRRPAAPASPAAEASLSAAAPR
jgi:N-acetylglucosaminyl-diphospho-decaprenol L-rhamnosyltransferase